MNERIKELADQAWDYALDHETVNGKAAFDSFINKNFSDLLLEKFAELIVRECCQKLENDGMVEVAMQMKQHFGVDQ